MLMLIANKLSIQHYPTFVLSSDVKTGPGQTDPTLSNIAEQCWTMLDQHHPTLLNTTLFYGIERSGQTNLTTSLNIVQCHLDRA